MLWQSYLWWREMMEARKRHTLRLSSIKRGKSNMIDSFEIDKLEQIQEIYDAAFKGMVEQGKSLGPIWDWMTAIKGIGPSLAAQLLAQIDYPAPFPGSYPDHCGTVSKLWAFAGWAVNNGEIQRCREGETSPYNRKLKSVCWLCVEQFIKHQTPLYVDLYYAEKERQRRLHPEKIKVNGKWKYNDGHLHNRAIRKTAKIFLQHLWVTWRKMEGLPVSEPYVQAIMHHTNIIEPILV